MIVEGLGRLNLSIIFSAVWVYCTWTCGVNSGIWRSEKRCLLWWLLSTTGYSPLVERDEHMSLDTEVFSIYWNRGYSE